MAEIVASAVVQEAMSRVSSFIWSKREEKASKRQSVERLEMALAELELALERSAKLPITDVSLLRRRKVFKRAYVEGADLLGKHKRQAGQGQDEIGIGQGAIRSSFPQRWITHARRNLPISSFLGFNGGDLCLSCSDVRRFEWFADCAVKFVRDVESGCSLRHCTFCNPVVRQLLEGKTLGCEMVQGTQARHCYIWPMCFEGRGVEAELQYGYEDRKMPEKGFRLALMLRLSESTDIAGIATQCLRSLASQFKLVTESAMGELSLLSNLQDISNSYFSPPLVGIGPQYIRHSDIFRPDPVCCKADGQGPFGSNIILSELSHVLPEPVMYADFRCYISAQECSLLRSTDETDRPPLEVAAAVVPHLLQEGLQEGYAYEVTGFKEQRREGSMQQMAEMVRSQAIDRFVRQPELTDYGMLWISAHGSAYYGVHKLSAEMATAPNAYGRSKTRRVAKRRRRNWM